VKPRRIGFLGFDGVQALDLVGPADAFASDAFAGVASDSELEGPRRPYEIVIIGLRGKRFVTGSGLTMRADLTVPTATRIDNRPVPAGAVLRRSGEAELGGRLTAGGRRGIGHAGIAVAATRKQHRRQGSSGGRAQQPMLQCDTQASGFFDSDVTAAGSLPVARSATVTCSSTDRRLARTAIQTSRSGSLGPA